MSYIEYIEFFTITLFLSSFFAMGGVGSAVALVPIFDFLGLQFLLAKATALFINTSTTITASYMNYKRGVLDIKFALPLVVTSLVTAPIGAYSSNFIDTIYVKYGFVIFLFFSATMMLISKKESKIDFNKTWILYLIGFFVGFISGILGVGGGSLVMPLMILLGFDAKKMAIAVSFMVPFSTFSAFLSYSSFVDIDYILLFITAIAAILGGFIGNKIMHFKLNSQQIKKIIAILLYLIAFKMFYELVL
ncbi:MAG: sulfite exporter TauE/SafE family protein [Campylobacterota bacterium]|nr:sulfite exporter TauE/SafE family protein [Campylobacterota bacterium]